MKANVDGDIREGGGGAAEVDATGDGGVLVEVSWLTRDWYAAMATRLAEVS